MVDASVASSLVPSTSVCNVEVRPSPVAGNGLFATKDIPAGSTILVKARPLIGELDLARLQDTCHNCFLWAEKASIGCAMHAAGMGRELGCPSCLYEQPFPTVKACTGCKKVSYCSKTCQKRSWNRHHKRECKVLRDPGLPPLPSAVRAALQLATMMNSDAISEEEKASISRLEAHDETTIRQSDDIMNFEVTVSAARDIFARITSSDDDSSQIREQVGKILRNSLTLTSPVLDPLGIALDPIACSANHSCDPNASVLFDAPRLLMRSLSPIKKGEEIFISYIDNTEPYYRRRDQLQLRYCFDCECTKCKLGPTQREDEWALPPESLERKWSSHAKAKDMDVLQGDAYAMYEKARQEKSTARAVDLLEDTMRLCKQTAIWPITRQPFANARIDITSRMLDQGRLALALYQMAKTYFLIDPILYPQDFHPVRVVHTYRLAKTLITAYTSPNNPDQKVDPGVQELFERGFDFVVPIWKILKKLCVDVLKSHGSGSKMAFVVASTAKQVGDAIGTDNLVMIERDPLEMWKEFERFALYLEY